MAIKNDYWIIGEKEEVEKFERKVDFKKDTIGISYNLLIPEFQQCVNETIRSLSDGKENFGYNLEKLIKLYKSAEPSISQLSICRQLLEDAEGFMSEEEAYDFSLNGDVGLSKRLDALKKRQDPKTYTKLYKSIQNMCDYFLIDIDLLKRGIGKVYLIEDSWFEKCIHDEEFLKEAKEMKWNMFNVRITIEKYEEYLKKKGILKKEEKILDEKWAVMTYTGMFLMLNKKEVDAVKKLIGNLVAYQIRNGINRFSYIEE